MLFLFFSCAFLIHSIESTINEDTAVGYVSGTIEEFIVEEPSAEYTEDIPDNNNYEEVVVENSTCNLIYLLDQKSEDLPELWQYNLHTGDLEYEADIQCSRNGTYENMSSMTGNTNGELWMISDEGNLFHFSTETMECHHVNAYSLRTNSNFFPIAITLSIKNQIDNPEFYLSGYFFGEYTVEIVFVKLTYDELHVVSSFEYEDTLYAPEIISSSQDELFGFVSISNNEQHLLEIDSHTGEYEYIESLYLDIESELTFFYNIDKFWFFKQEENQTEIHTFNPITKDISFKSNLDLSVVGSSLAGGCEQEGVAY